MQVKKVDNPVIFNQVHDAALTRKKKKRFFLNFSSIKDASMFLITAVFSQKSESCVSKK